MGNVGTEGTAWVDERHFNLTEDIPPLEKMEPLTLESRAAKLNLKQLAVLEQSYRSEGSGL